jgi:hypothetical protein
MGVKGLIYKNIYEYLCVFKCLRDIHPKKKNEVWIKYLVPYVPQNKTIIFSLI